MNESANKAQEGNDMANTHSLFQDFCSEITLSQAKSNNLKTSRNALRSEIKHWFSEKGKKQPSFCWQGSFSMKTLINPLPGGEYDLDDGVYIHGYKETEMGKWPAPATVHGWVKDAIKDQTNSDPIDKDTCIRVCYSAGYHIDLPIYIVKDDVAYLAHKGKGWLESDPKAFRSWFIDKVSSDTYGEQLRSVVKYLKAWKDYKGIPLKGIEVTILAVENFEKYDDRDDKCLRDTVESIIASLKEDFSCCKPVAPWENLFDDASATKQKSILDGFDALKTNLDKAIDESNEKTATEYLRKSFGNRFPLGKDISTKTAYAASAAPGVLKHDGRSA